MEPSAASRDALSQLQARLPSELEPLARVAFNYAWSWQPDGEALFRDFDPELWVACGRNPVRLLSETARIERACTSDIPLRAQAVLAQIESELATPTKPTWEAHAERPIAYFCAEFGVHASLPSYAGGLGVLAGDFLKEASDRRLPVIGVGLFYHRGDFHQRLDLTGLQHEYWVQVLPEQLPMRLVRSADGAPLHITVELRGRPVVFPHVTNGVHLATWMAPMRQLLRRLLGEDWESAQDDPERWSLLQRIPDEELWKVRHAEQTHGSQARVWSCLGRELVRHFRRSLSAPFLPEDLGLKAGRVCMSKSCADREPFSGPAGSPIERSKSWTLKSHFRAESSWTRGWANM